MTSGSAGTTLRAPRSEPERIASLMQRISDGDIKLPTFQRRLVWNVDQVVDLLDSIYQGYPIGSLLFWRTNTRLLSERDIGGFPLPDTQEEYPKNYILDGQQRLTALYAVLNYPVERVEKRFKVVFDLEERKFIEAEEPIKSTHLPLTTLYKMSEYTNFIIELRAREDSDELVSETEKLWEIFREYAIPVVTVINAPIDQVGVIFERINSRGTRLTIFDLMVAATWGAQKDEEFNLRSKINEVLEQLAEKDYSGFDEVVPVKFCNSAAL